jgi:hypothetical protein
MRAHGIDGTCTLNVGDFAGIAGRAVHAPGSV